MAGSRVHQYGSIIRRTQGLLKSEAVAWKDRPLWYDVVLRFPPAVEPVLERPVPDVEVKKILYPEDFVRAKIFQVYDCNEPVNMLKKQSFETSYERIVKEYIARQKPGAKPEQIFDAIDKELKDEIALHRKKKEEPVVEIEPVEEVEFDVEDTEKAKPRKQIQEWI